MLVSRQIGDVVSLRARPTDDDPRSEWPAVVRRVVFLRSGEPALFVNWLVAKGRDTYFDGDANDPDVSSQPLVTEETSESQGKDRGRKSKAGTGVRVRRKA